MPTLEDFRAFYLEKVDAFNRRDWETVLEGLPDRFEWHFPAGVVDREGPAGPSELGEAVRDLVSQFPDLQVEPVEIVEPVAGSFAVRLVARGAGAASGAALQFELAQLWEFEGDEPVRAREFGSLSAALANARQ